MSAICEKCEFELWQGEDGKFMCPACTLEKTEKALEYAVKKLDYEREANLIAMRVAYGKWDSSYHRGIADSFETTLKNIQQILEQD